jgi:phage protein D
VTIPSRVCVVRVDGQVDEGLYRDLIAVEVCDEHDGASSFAIKLGIYLKDDGTWTRLDEGDGNFQVWQRITIEAGFEGSQDVLIDGYVAGVAPYFAPKGADSYLLVWGYDATYGMAQEEKIRSWSDVKYSDVASTIFESYGLGTDNVEDSQVIHAEDDRLLIQRGSDWQFLKLLASRLGYEVFVRGGQGYFRPPQLTSTPQKDLAAHFGPSATNLLWFHPKVVGHMPTTVLKSRANVTENKVENIEVATSPHRALGDQDGNALRSGRDAAGAAKMIARPDPAISEQEMELLATGARRRTDWVVEAEGEIDGMLYGVALKANRLVLVKGIGRTFSGMYYVTKVIHHFTPEEYKQRFWARRNGVGLLGSEDFAAADALEVEPAPQGASDDRIETRSSGRVVAP